MTSLLLNRHLTGFNMGISPVSHLLKMKAQIVRAMFRECPPEMCCLQLSIITNTIDTACPKIIWHPSCFHPSQYISLTIGTCQVQCSPKMLCIEMKLLFDASLHFDSFCRLIVADTYFLQSRERVSKTEKVAHKCIL